MDKQSHIPPRWGERLLLWFCAEDRVEEILGDLDEYYDLYASQYPGWRAKGYYAYHVLSYLRLYNWKKRQNSNNWSMFRNYILIAWRSIIKNPGYAAINIIGLAVGIAFSALMYIYVSNELSYDSFHAKSDQLYRIITVDKRIPDDVRRYGQIVPPVGPALVEDYPEVVGQVRLYQPNGQIVFDINGEKHQEREWFVTHNDFFKYFDFEFLYGNAQTAFASPKSMVITEKAAQKYFGRKDLVGEVLETGGYGPVTITGVLRDLPENSHLKFSMLFSDIDAGEDWANYLNSWQSFGAYTYILLAKNSNIADLSNKMPAFGERYMGPMAQVMSIEYQAIRDIYLASERIEGGINDKTGEVHYIYIYIFGSLGFFILLFASINYINIATAKATFRAKEIGVRKSIGAARGQLMMQFVTESFVVTGLAYLIATAILFGVLPYFNVMADTSFAVDRPSLMIYLLPLTAIAMTIALLSGTYPALYLSRQKAADTLKGEVASGKSSAGLRKGLVVFQFVLTIVMILSTIVISRQLNYISDKELGFDEDRLLVIDINSRNVRAQFQTMKNELAAIPGVDAVGVSSRVPMEWKNIGEVFMKSDYSELAANDSVKSYLMGFDEGMKETFKFEMDEGSYFESNSANDSTRIILNESAVDALKLKDPIGARISILRGGSSYDGQVIGVVKDFNFQSLHQKISPLIIGAWNNPASMIDYFTLKVSGNVASVIDAAASVHDKFDLNSPMEYHFLDQQMDKNYEAEQRAGLIFKLGAVLSILVACLGLFGLASFTIQRKAKELGIRKVLGAGDGQLFVLLSSSFAKQVAVAVLIATPIGYYVTNEWLSAFEYHIDPGVGTFILSGLIAAVIALLTISYRAYKAVHSNPVDSLKYE
ncbi:MAG: ABC transporter permease [Cyclobacteriaceae bacterium]